MAIIAEKKIERQTKHGIEVDIDFIDNSNMQVVASKTLLFIDRLSLDNEYSKREAKAITNIEDLIVEKLKPTAVDFIEYLDKYFEKNSELTNVDYVELKNTGLVTVKAKI